MAEENKDIIATKVRENILPTQEIKDTQPAPDGQEKKVVFENKTVAESVFSDSPAVQKEKKHNIEVALEQLSPAQREKVENYVTKHAPNKKVAYGLWLVTGLIGGHRFYLHDYAPAVLMIIMLYLFPAGDVVWWLVEAYLLKRNLEKRIWQLREEKLKKMAKASAKAEKKAQVK